MGFICFVLALCTALDEPYEHESPRFRMNLPSAEWQCKDQGQGGVVVLVFTPVEDMSTRCSVLRFPVSFLPDGLRTREQQMQQAVGDGYVRVALEPGTISGREVQRWEYTIFGGTSIEWGFEEDGWWVLFQVAGPASVWQDEAQRAELMAIADSFEWTGGVSTVTRSVDSTPPEQVRALRPSPSAAARPFEVTNHEIEATIEPADHSLDVLDTLHLVARQDDLREIRLYTTIVTVDDVTADVPLSWHMEELPQADVLVIEPEAPLADGQELTLVVHAACDDFFQGVDQQLVAEIAVVGQIRPRSSWSSHVVWYPMDEVNDAVVDITFDVPAPYTAVTGGILTETSESDGRRRFRYVEEQRVRRGLPFGFAVAEYEQGATVSDAGLNLTVFAFPGEEKRIAQRLEVLRDCAAAFERALGPLPWQDVRFVHVTPEKKETGVSLPGMILVSDGYFPDLEGVNVEDGNLSNPKSLGLLVVADELSHQWNFYAAGFPNELAEGISTYTNALFVEVRHGAEAYARTIAYCRDAWLSGAGPETEFAIANPAVYSNGRYRAVVFCKTPVVLDALRRRLGDEVFFDGFRRAFANEDPDVDGFDRMQQGFEAASGQDLQWFFDQWFFRAGFPTLQCEFEPAGARTRILVTQTQPEEPYRMAVDVTFDFADGSPMVTTVELEDREYGVELELPEAPTAVTLGPAGRLPAEITR